MLIQMLHERRLTKQINEMSANRRTDTGSSRRICKKLKVSITFEQTCMGKSSFKCFQ